jgi:hypothetical protein
MSTLMTMPPRGLAVTSEALAFEAWRENSLLGFFNGLLGDFCGFKGLAEFSLFTLLEFYYPLGARLALSVMGGAVCLATSRLL